jgi:hypothetical protein
VVHVLLPLYLVEVAAGAALVWLSELFFKLAGWL